MIQVGRWYRMVRILNLGTPDVADGSYDVWIYDDSMALVAHMFVHNVKMLSSIYDGESGHPKPDQGYIRKTIWSHYHPGGNSVNPRKKPFTDFVCYANLYISAVPFE